LLGQPYFVEALQVHPERWAGAEPVAEPEYRVAGNGALALDDLGDPDAPPARTVTPEGFQAVDGSPCRSASVIAASWIANRFAACVRNAANAGTKPPSAKIRVRLSR
jgi:hypothetical protein